MILSQKFLSSAGVRKRIAFENAHSKTHYFSAVRYYRDKVDNEHIRAERMPEYYWRIQKQKL